MNAGKKILLLISFFCVQHLFAKEQLLRIDREQLKHLIAIPDSSISNGDTNSVEGQKHLTENKRLIAAILAFPVPFGVFGLHRIYLRTAPYVPVVYILTLGGAGIISLIDFIEIVTADDETFASFENNPKIFMWP